MQTHRSVMCSFAAGAAFLGQSLVPSLAQINWTPFTEYPVQVYQADSALVGERLYVAGGTTPAAVSPDVYFAQLTADGPPSNWVRSLTLPVADPGPGLAQSGGWVYLVLTNGAVFRVQVPTDSSLGPWIAEASMVGPSLSYSSVLRAYNGVLYLFGRFEGTPRNTLRFARINADGSLGPWEAGSFPLPLYRPVVLFNGGRAYVAGGVSSGTMVSAFSYSAAVNADGSLGAWRQEPDLPGSLWNSAGLVVSNNLVLLGGLTNLQVGSAVDYMTTGALAADGSITHWTTQPALPFALSGSTALFAPAQDSVYLVGGANAAGEPLATAWRWTLNPPPTPNFRPVAQAQSIPVRFATARAVVLSGSDPDGDALTFTVVTQPTNGLLTGLPPNLVYLPNTGFFGTDAFTFTVSDGELTSAAAVVTLNVGSENEAPLAIIRISPLVSLGAGDPIAIAGRNGSANVFLDGSESSDPEGDALAFTWDDNASFLSHEGTFETELAVGVHNLSLVVSDGTASGTNSATLRVLSLADSVRLLMTEVQRSSLPRNRQRPLLASLRASAASFDKGRAAAGCNQLLAFLAKNRLPVTGIAPELAAEWNVFTKTIRAAAQD